MKEGRKEGRKEGYEGRKDMSGGGRTDTKDTKGRK
jgi:hypothetical protein